MGKEGKARLVLLIASVAFAALLGEALFRLHLHLAFERYAVGHRTIRVHDAPLWEYDRDLGFTYPRNGSAHMTLIRDRGEILCQPFSTDSNGDPGRIPEVRDPARTVYVFGDSFTSLPLGPDGDITWPGLMQEMLDPEQRVQVRNLSRDGIGFLQMLDQAAARMEADAPDLAVIAFITQDLTRARIWRDTRPGADGRDMAVTSLDPDISGAPGTLGLTTFLDPRATRQWCDALGSYEEQGPGQAAEQVTLLDDILARYARAVRVEVERNGGEHWLFSPTTSYLYQQILHGDPFQHLRFSRRTMSLDMDDYGQDPGFAHALERIKATGTPVLLVWLPMHEEMARGGHVLKEQEQALLQCLLDRSGFPLLDLAPDMPMGESADPLFLLPVDSHPSLEGLQWYARRAAEMLPEQW